MLSRKVVTRRGRRFRGYFPSHKLGRMVPWESFVERDAILLLEISSGVVSYKAQPTVIYYFDGSKFRKYYPDFEVVLSDGSMFHLEIKLAEELKKPELKTKFRLIASHYQNIGFGFKIVTEEDLRREPLLSNAQTLAYLRSKRSRPLPSPTKLYSDLGIDIISFAEAEALLGRDTILHLIAHGLLACDLSQPLSGDTLLTLVTGEGHASILL